MDPFKEPLKEPFKEPFMDPFKGLLDPFKERFLLAGAGDPLGGFDAAKYGGDAVDP